MRQRRHDPVDGKVLHDDAGGEREHLRFLDAERFRRGGAGRLRIGQSFGAGARVRDPRVHDNGADRLVVVEALAAERDGGGGEAVAREDARHAARLVDRDEQQVLAIGLADAGARHAQAHSRDGEEVFGARRLEVDGHLLFRPQFYFSGFSLIRAMAYESVKRPLRNA